MVKILIADDEPEITDLLTRYFNEKAEVSQTLSANKGNDAWDIVIKEKPEIVLIDINMPGFKGQYFLKKLKAEGITDINVFVVTPFGEKDQVDEVLKLGAKGYVAKPFSFAELDEKILSIANQIQSKVK